jgi:hypothetical protein
MEPEKGQPKRRLKTAAARPGIGLPWWEERFGGFQDDPIYDLAMRLGAEYRAAQPIPADDDHPA